MQRPDQVEAVAVELRYPTLVAVAVRGGVQALGVVEPQVVSLVARVLRRQHRSAPSGEDEDVDHLKSGVIRKMLAQSYIEHNAYP
jgi:hypothetical protein